MKHNKTVLSLLFHLKNIGCQVWLENGKLKIRTGQDGIPDNLRDELKQQKAAIIEFLSQSNAQDSGEEKIPKRLPDAPLVMSFAQQRLWFLNQFEGSDSAAYNMPAALSVVGALNLNALQHSLHWLLDRHHSLRTCFATNNGEAQIQVLGLDAISPLTVHDLTDLLPETQTIEVQNRANQHAVAPFDLANGPLFKADVLQLSDDHAVLLLNMHHIISDGWSIGVFLRDWQHAYTAFAQGKTPQKPPLEIQYQDYAAWQRDWLAGEVLQQQLDYWQTQLAGLPERLQLPTDKPRPPQQSYQGAHYRCSLSTKLTTALNHLSQHHSVSLFMTLLASFNMLLARYSRQDDICVGSPIANRTHHQTEELIGFFVNTLVLRGQLNPQQSFIELLNHTRQTCLGAYAHQDIPFEMLVEQLQPTRSLSHSPLFQVMLVLQNNQVTELTLPDLQLNFLKTEYPIAKFDLTLNVEDKNGQLHCVWEYATDLFHASTIERMAGHFETLLNAIVASPEQALSQLSMLTEAEIQQLKVWNETATDYPQDNTIVDLFERQVAKTPDNIAVVFEGKSLTYQQLNAKANQLAHYLLARMNPAETAALPLTSVPSLTNPLIVLAVDRSLEMVIGLLAILKAGGAYVPIDPSYPIARIQHMLTDSAAPILLTQTAFKAQFSVEMLPQACVAIYLDVIQLETHPSTNPIVPRNPADLAYVIYTSGSTGTPKGVMIAHQGVVNLAVAQINAFQIHPDSRLLQFASCSFDASVSEIVTTLLTGACLHLISATGQLTLTTSPVLSHITHVTLPPSLLTNMTPQALPELQTVVVAGEACPAELMQDWAQQVRFINAYGPTENTVCTSMAICTPAMKIPVIGQPIANTRIYILNRWQQLQPPGIAGELCIAGVGLARGYLNRPDLTAEKFIEVELFGVTERIYQTGDLARWLPDGNLEYLGRLDHQVKLRGFRIELGEIETVLSQHTAVKAAVVTLYAQDTNQALAAYVTVNDTSAELITALKDWVKACLPDYMVPSYITVLDQLPLTPNGKIDRNALPAPETHFTDSYEAPRNDIESQLAQIWRSLLKIDSVGVHDNFFGLGGDSILSIQIVAAARQMGLQLTPRDLFQYQTIAELAHVVHFASTVAAEQGLITGTVPLTPIQHWFFNQQFPEFWHFNQSMLLEAVDLDIDALKQAVAVLLSHHDALRLRYQEVDGEWQQAFSEPTEAVPLIVEDLSTTEHPTAALLEITETYQQRFNLAQGPLIYLVLCKWSGQARLFWCIHHLVVDGVSWRILVDDLQTAYQQIVAKQLPQLPAKTSSYQAWAEQLAAYMHSDALTAELNDWQTLPHCSLPMDNPNGANRLEHLQHTTLTLSHAATEALLKQVPVAYNTQINDILLTALALTLHEWTGHAQCLIDLEGHGRADLFNDIDLSRTVGWFTSVHPVALTLPADLAVGTAIKAVKEQLRATPHAGIGYGLLVQRGEMLPKGQILFNYLGQFDAGTARSDFRFASEATASDMSHKGQRDHLLDINGFIIDGQLSLTWTYSQDCYRADTVERLTAQYQQHLDTLLSHCQAGPQGVTPADFPLATVLQTTLDALYRQYSGLQDLYPLSPMQQGMLFHALYEPETGVYFEQMHLTLTHLDPKAFKAAWQHQLARHPIFRSAFLTEHSPILQVVQAHVALLWREHDWRTDSTEVQQTQLQQLLQQERQHGFVLNQAPLMRFDLIRLDEQRYVFVQHHHHILIDGWCLPIIVSEVRESYLAFKQGQTPQLPSLRPYRDYIAWLQQQDTAAAEHYWQQRLAGLSAPTPLPIISHQTQTPAYQERSYTLSVENTQHLHQCCQSQRVTLNTLIQGAWGLLLSRYSRESNICFGVTVSGRQAALSGIEQMIGLFINTLPLHLHTEAENTVKDYLLAVQTQHQSDNRYAYTPLFEIQRLSEVPNGTALFESLLVFENYPLGDALQQPADSFQIEAFTGIEYSNYPLTIAVMPGASLQLKISYDCQRISQAAIERLWGHLTTLLMAMVANPQQAIGQLLMLTEPEIQQIHGWNQTATDYPQEHTMVDLFEQQVAQTPDNIAVVFEGESLTYQQLNAQANQLAHHLIQLKQPAQLPDNPLIALAVERSLDMVIGLLGVLKAGGAYVPIEPNYPAARIQSILKDSAAPILLTQRALKAQLSLARLANTCDVICLDDNVFDSQSTDNPLIPNRSAKDLAYIIYTSGSTGTPKGVVVSHQAVVNLIAWVNNTFQIGENDRVLFVTSMCFDLSVYDIFGLLSAGGSVHIASQQMLDEPQQLLETLYQHPITFWDSVPAFFQQLVPLFKAPATINHALRLVFFSGDWIPVTLPDQIKAAFPGAKVIGLGGATEATVWSNYYPIESVNPAWKSIPYGKPIQNAQYYILDAQLNLCPIGVPGALYIGGTCLANGYTDPQQTEQRFIANPFHPDDQTRLYHTGDLARWLADGNIEFLGRLDNQIKLRGFRIELGEIESLLIQHKSVEAAIVMLYEGQHSKQLVAYITATTESNELVSILTAHLKAHLPDYMLPSHISILDKLPLTPNGKIDRKALPAPATHSTDGYAAPRNDIEQQLAQLWSQFLKIDHVGIHDNFFGLGGDSILSIQIVAGARQVGLHLTPRDLFQHQTIAELAHEVRFATAVDAEQALMTGEAPLTPIQQWFFTQQLAEPWHFNQSVLLQVPVNLEIEALKQALAQILAHHDALRLRYQAHNGAWRQSFSVPTDAVPLIVEDLSSVDDPATALLQITQTYQQAFNLAEGPLTYLVLLTWTGQARLFWCIHHLVVDGVSWRILLDDLHTAYQQAIAQQRPQLPRKTSSYKAWAEQLARYADNAALSTERSYWQALPNIALPTDNPNGANRLEHTQQITCTLTHAATEALLKQVPTAYNTQINDILLTALALTLHEWTGNLHCLINLEGHGRVALFNDIDVSRTVGWFTSIHPVALTLPTDLDLGAAIKAIKEQLRAVPHEGIGHGVLTQRGELLPTGQILFNYLGQFDAGTEDTDFRLANEATASDVSCKGQRQHLLDINGAIIGGQLSLTWTYSSECYQAATLARLTDNYQQHLHNIIAHCQAGQQGVTPSDFPLATVTQTTLDALYCQYTGLQDLYPLTPMQEGILFHTLYESIAGVYIEQIQLTLTNLEPNAFKAAWQHQLERHPIFRSAFLPDHHPILQLVQTKVPLPWHEQDWSALPRDEQQIQLQQLLQHQRQQGFDLSQAPLMRFDLIRVDEQGYCFIHHFHHILMDGWCLPILFNEVHQSYLAFKQGQTRQLSSLRPYKDYIAWLQSQDRATAQQYWQHRLAGFTAPTSLPILTHQTQNPVYREISYTLSNEHTQRLHHFCQHQRITLNTLVQGAWGILLSRYSGDANICFGVTVSGRQASLSGIEQMIGLFINTLPLYIHTQAQDCVKDYLLAIQTHHQNDNRYAYTPLFDIQQLSEVPNGTALFDSLLVFENYPLGDAVKQAADSVQVEAFNVIEYINYPLTLMVMPDKALHFKIHYDSQRLSPTAIEQLWGHLHTVLMAMVAHPQLAISQLPMLTAMEIQQLQTWNKTETAYPQTQTVVDLFQQQVAKTPDNIALVFAEQSLTYQQLNAKANQVAHHILQHKQQAALPDNPLIAIAVERALELVIGLLGILKAGGAYVPIDPNYPTARIAHMLTDSAAPILLTQSPLTAQLPLGALAQTCEVICLDDKVFETQSSENPVINRHANHLAYVIYTSGSTGKPKGVMLEQHNLLNFLLDMQQRTGIQENDKLLAVTTLSFDIAALELYLPIISGSCLHLATQAVASDGLSLQRYLAQQAINFMQATPATWQLLKHSHWQPDASLNILCGGEALPPELANYLLANSQTLLNVYGPTETTIWSTTYLIQHHLSAYPAIGTPISNTRIYILDAHNQPQPPNIPGELCIAGAGVARGYLNRPELTAEKFIDMEIFGKTERIYKTGDLARWLPDGNLEYLGRIDHQIKLRGFRIELGEIEAVLSQHPTVAQSVVNCIAPSDAHSEHKRLIAYIVPHLDVNSAEENEFLNESNQDVVNHWAQLWGQLYNDTYAQVRHDADLDFNTTGWNSSYTGAAIPAEEMRAWTETTVAAIRHLQPQEVLEIGCGTGLLLSRIAPHTQTYWGVDFSSTVIQQVEHLKQSVPELAHVVLKARTADDFEGIQAEQFDTVILNSVIQYFPNVDYLIHVLEQAIAVIKPGGHLFVGDVRHLPLLRTFHASVQLFQADEELSQSELRQRVAHQQLTDKELVIDPHLFIALYQQHPRVTGVKIRPHRGETHNELTCFRYQAILDIEHPATTPTEVDWQDWQPTLTLTQLRQQLQHHPATLAICNIANLRLARDTAIVTWLDASAATELTVGELRQTLATTAFNGLDPEALWQLGAQLGYHVDISWQTATTEGVYDVLFSRDPSTAQSIRFPMPRVAFKQWRDYANTPLQGQLHDKLIPQLRESLKDKLPDYMLPSQFMVLDKLPLTPNGKIDRKALPEPNKIQHTGHFTPPQTQLEREIAVIWQEVLQVDKVGLHDNFFELGGHSLLIMQVHSRLRTVLDNDTLTVVKLFQYPTVASLVAYLSDETPQAPTQASRITHTATDDIAIIGMAGRFPGANDIDTFWDNLRQGVEGIQFFSDAELLASGIAPQLLDNPNFVKAKGIVEGAAQFDAQFFGYTPKDAEVLDPQQRLFLETAWTAIEYAGYDVARLAVSVGVFAGVSPSTYFTNNLMFNPDVSATVGDFQVILGNDKDYITTRTAYKLNLAGPAFTIQTACSTSLVAVHVACQSLLNGECEMALAGGTSITSPQKQGYLYQPGMILSPDGHCRAFDAAAQGTVSSEGVGVVVLKRLSQALAAGDTIHAVIKGHAINNDGMNKVGYTAPSVDGQAAVIAQAMHGLDYDSISYIETHGTGTTLGDPIEISALTQAYRMHTQKTGYCALGAVKTNIGHLADAAGVAGLIKAVLALKHREIPATLHFETPNPQIDFANSPFFVNATLRAWEAKTPRRAGVSSFGIGGTNAHVVLEEAPAQTSTESTQWQLLCLSARTATALQQARHNLADYLTAHPQLNLADVAYTLNLGRKAFMHRGCLIARSVSEAAGQLSATTSGAWRHNATGDNAVQVVFMFPGQGAQYVKMAAGLYQDEAVFRDSIDECAALLKPHLKRDIRDLLYSDATDASLEPTQWAQPALFVTEYALAKLCMAWGIQPMAMIGHSIGEYVAACLTGVFSLADALKLVAKRGELMQALPSGDMLSVSLSKAALHPYLTEDLAIAAHNAPGLCVVSGNVTAIEILSQTLQSQQIECRRLQTSHAFHSAMMTPMLPAFRDALHTITLNPPQLPYISNVTGDFITAEQATSVNYWCEHLRHTVQFSKGLATLLAHTPICLELGPGRALSSLARQHQADSPVQAFNLLRSATATQTDGAFLRNTLGALWLQNVTIDWSALYADQHRLRIPLPTYPFERQRYWIEPVNPKWVTPPSQVTDLVKQPLDKWFYLPQWKLTPPVSPPDSEVLQLSPWLIFQDETELGMALTRALQAENANPIIVYSGVRFIQHHAHCYTLNPSQHEDYQRLFEALAAIGQVPQGILHLWCLDPTDDLAHSQALSFYSLLYLAQTWPSLEQARSRYLLMLSNQIHAVTGAEHLHPLFAPLLGLVQTISAEYRDLHCRNIDIALPATHGLQRALVKKLLAECQMDCWERSVAYRHQRRWIRHYEPVDFPSVTPQTLVLRQHGVYLMTEGLRGIGLSLANYLAETVQAKLILIEHSAFPAPHAWDDWLQTHPADNLTTLKIHSLRKLQGFGAETLVLSAEFGNREQMQTAITQSNQQFGDIDGVIHAIGEPKSGLLEFKTPSDAAQMLASKQRGCLVLHELLAEQQPDFMVFCSSQSALRETPETAHECAVSAFVDAYAQALATQGFNAISINWNWEEEGIAAAEGGEVFARILASPMPQVLISTTDWLQRLQLQQDAQTLTTEPVADATTVEVAQHHRPALTTEYGAPRTSLEQQVADIWQRLLGIEPIGIHDDFFELGGHSLLAAKLMSHIQQQCGVHLPASALFQSPTIAMLAEQLQADTAVLSNNLVPIQTTGQGHPVYCLPGVIGSVMYLYSLASSLGQPCYALPTPGLEGAATPTTLAALATHHLQALQQQQPTGPYYLIGHSAGGRVAFEMAGQLEQQGECVAFLAIIDTNAPNAALELKQFTPDDSELHGLVGVVRYFEALAEIDLNCSLATLQALPNLEIAYTQVLQAFINQEVLFAPGTPIDDLKALVNTYRITAQAYLDYQTTHTLRCPIHLFRALDSLSNLDSLAFKDPRPTWGWAAHTQADVIEHSVPGNHFTMMTPPHVHALAAAINGCLREKA